MVARKLGGMLQDFPLSRLMTPEGLFQRVVAIVFVHPRSAKWLDLHRVQRLLTTMTSEDVLAVLGALRQAGVEARIAGGWGVDALVGRQTRRHADLDLVIRDDELEVSLESLSQLGYRTMVVYDIPEALLEPRYVLRDRKGRMVDLLTVDLGELAARCAERVGRVVDIAWLEASGEIERQRVDCLSASAQVVLYGVAGLDVSTRWTNFSSNSSPPHAT